MMNKFNLPPKVNEIIDGSVVWKQVPEINYESLGYFLSCHLTIEHYLDEYLKIEYPALNWKNSRQTFGQKLSLLSNFKISDKYDCIPAIKHMNSLRNKLSHQLDFIIEMPDLLPIVQYLEKIVEDKNTISNEPKEVLSFFTLMTCSLFAGVISAKAQRDHKDVK